MLQSFVDQDKALVNAPAKLIRYRRDGAGRKEMLELRIAAGTTSNLQNLRNLENMHGPRQ